MVSGSHVNEAAENILLIDDDVELCELVEEYLRTEGFEIDVVHNGSKGLERILSSEPTLVILDVMLPGTNGFEVLRRIRSRSQVPVLMLTARGDDIDRIVGLEIGADDYLPKPFNPRELVARIRAILRRSQSASSDLSPPLQKKMVVGDVELEPGSRVVLQEGEPVQLTAVEFDLLECLLRQAGTVIKREDLVETVLGRAFNPFDRSIDMHVSNLRKKLGVHGEGTERIKSIRSVGYIYTQAGEPDSG